MATAAEYFAVTKGKRCSLTGMTLYADALSMSATAWIRSLQGLMRVTVLDWRRSQKQSDADGSITIIAVTALNDGDITHAFHNTGYITEGQLSCATRIPGKSSTRSLPVPLKQLVQNKKRGRITAGDECGCAALADAQNAKTKLENGFDLSDYDRRCLAYAKEYATRLLSIDVNITITEMLDTAWELFGKYFSKAETGIKQSFIDTYWKGN